MQGTFFTSPDCLEPLTSQRSIDELAADAAQVSPRGVFVVSDSEFRQIARQVGLAYRWQGKRLAVIGDASACRI